MIKSQVVAHSIDPRGNELVSILATFPRIILAEVNTHRMLSKNTSSSRAIPFNKMVEAVKENPFIPIAWQKEHKGMQGNEYITDFKSLNIIKEDWLNARDYAIEQAVRLNKGDIEGKEGFAPVTKQLANRLLEPFMWTTMLITGPRYGGGWDNFFNLRCPQYHFELDDRNEIIAKSKKEVINAVHESELSILDKYTIVDWLKRNIGQAEIHMMALAESIYDSINESIPKELEEGEWHIPFHSIIEETIDDKCKGIYYPSDENVIEMYTDTSLVNEVAIKVSTAMAARTSYTIIGEEKELSYGTMINLHDRLITQNPPHSSPMEHCAKVMTIHEYNCFIKGELETYGETNNGLAIDGSLGWCRNFKGFIPYRHIIETN